VLDFFAATDHSVDGIPVQVARKVTNNAMGASNNSLRLSHNEEEDEINTTDVWKSFQSGNTSEIFEPKDEQLAAGTMCVFGPGCISFSPHLDASLTIAASVIA
jgi:hypothetical protein